MTIPPFDRVGKPIFEDLYVIDMVPLQGSSDDDALHRLRHIEPGTSTGRVQQPNAMFVTPGHHIAAVMAGQIIQNEQHAQRRVEPIQLFGCRKRIPLLPTPLFWNRFWSGRTLFENGLQFFLEPGMQDSVGTLINRFGPQFSGGGSK